ncbi:MAG TPA: hypothetical protein VIJ60_06955 [Acidimicrobiales bacterium]
MAIDERFDGDPAADDVEPPDEPDEPVEPDEPPPNGEPPELNPRPPDDPPDEPVVPGATGRELPPIGDVADAGAVVDGCQTA